MATRTADARADLRRAQLAESALETLSELGYARTGEHTRPVMRRHLGPLAHRLERRATGYRLHPEPFEHVKEH